MVSFADSSFSALSARFCGESFSCGMDNFYLRHKRSRSECFRVLNKPQGGANGNRAEQSRKVRKSSRIMAWSKFLRAVKPADLVRDRLHHPGVRRLLLFPQGHRNRWTFTGCSDRTQRGTVSASFTATSRQSGCPGAGRCSLRGQDIRSHSLDQWKRNFSTESIPISWDGTFGYWDLADQGCQSTL